VKEHFTAAAAAESLAALHESAVLADHFVADGTLVEENFLLAATALDALLGHGTLLIDSQDSIKGAEGNPAFLIT
jgi:hypothetical protein